MWSVDEALDWGSDAMDSLSDFGQVPSVSPITKVGITILMPFYQNTDIWMKCAMYYLRSVPGIATDCLDGLVRVTGRRF